MVTRILNGGGSPLTFYGLSTDNKPTTVFLIVGKNHALPNASIFYEMDTGDIYMWDAEGEIWRKQ